MIHQKVAMPPDFIDLGSKPEVVSDVKIKNEPSVYYPSLHINASESLDMPDEGIAQIKYRLGSVTKTTRDGKTRYSCDLEILGIKPVGEKKKGGLSEAIDSIAAKKYSEDSEEGED